MQFTSYSSAKLHFAISYVLLLLPVTRKPEQEATTELDFLIWPDWVTRLLLW